MGENTPKDVFATYKPEEHPPYNARIMDEAGGNLELADLIEIREITYFDYRAADLDQQAGLAERLHKLEEEIAAKKVGLNLPGTE